MLNKGDIVDNTYLIDSIIGQGALGVVYKAYHMRLQKYVVLKRIKSDKVFDDHVRVEVDTLKTLKHEYLPQVYDYLEINAGIYTVIDYIEGVDLKKMTENGAYFSQEELIKWLRQLCSVLKYLGNCSPPVVHSDIKPDNIMIDKDGNVCLIDFNIAGGAGLTEDYASPEQLAWFEMYRNGDPRYYECAIDCRSDIYSLGSTFYYLMTRFTPNIKRYDVPPLSAYNGLIYSEALTEIIDRMRCYDIQQRFQTPDEIFGALDNIKRSDGRYKKYILMQTVGTAFFVILLVVGVSMIIHGTAKIHSDNIYRQYSAVAEMYKKGDYSETIRLGMAVLNKGDLDPSENGSEIADILCFMGDSELEREEYRKAVYYYKEAYQYMETLRNRSDFYVNYVLALAKSDDVRAALSISEDAAKDGLNSSEMLLLNAEIKYVSGDYVDAMEEIEECLASSLDTKKKAKCYLLLAEIYDIYHDYRDSMNNYQMSLQNEESPNTLRKCARTYIKWNERLELDDAMYRENLRNAEKCLRKIYENYAMQYEDYINLGNLNKSMGNYDFALAVLDKGRLLYPKDYKIYLYMALIYEEKGDTHGAAENIEKAMQYSSNADMYDKDYQELERIYSKYY